MFCVFNEERRTNNDSESLNNQINKQIKHHPNVFRFMARLSSFYNENMVKYDREIMDKHEKKKSVKTIRIEKKINREYKRFEETGDVHLFLQKMARGKVIYDPILWGEKYI